MRREPERKPRIHITWARVLCFTGVHLLVAGALLVACWLARGSGPTLKPIEGFVAGMLVSFAPFWGLLWAYLYVKRVNAAIEPWYCRACGYDLTGNESGRCPECATEIEQA